MPAPFVIAHLQIAQLLEDSRAALATTQRAQVFLTNALTGWIPARHPQSTFGFPAFTAERDAAEAVKQADTILVILGNPPYNGYAGIAKIEEERDLTVAYRTPVPGLTAPQGQGLNDLYIRFFRIAERRIVGDAEARGNPGGRGLVSFISNNAWLDGLSHVSMRARYLAEFQHIYIDNLNGDKYRTGKTTPDGKPDPSAFSTPHNREGIQVGTAIATMVRVSPGAASKNIELRDLWGTHKLSHLDREAKREVEPRYDSTSPVAALGLPFAERAHNADYASWPRVPELFSVTFPGVKTSRDSVVIDIDRATLEARMVRYHDETVSNEDITREMPDVLSGSAHFDPRETRRILQKRGFRPWQVMRYTYRPFDVRWLYWEPITDLLDRKREEFVYEQTPNSIWFEIRQRESSSSFSRGSVSTALSDQVGNGMSHFVPSLVYRTELFDHGLKIVPNLTEAAQIYCRSVAADQNGVFFHALSILHTPRYRAENAGALLNDWPRIPIPETAELLEDSAALGLRLADLLDPESNINLAAEWSFLARLAIAAEYPEGTPDRDRRNAARLAVTAGWGGRGQGDTVMPRRGKAPERDWTSTELKRLAALAAVQNLTLDGALALLGPRCVDVYLNDAASWAAVPTKVWEYTLGGYQVLKKWLSYREEPLLGRPLHEDEARYFSQVVRRIAAILLLGPALDASYGAILPTARGLSGDLLRLC